MSSDYADSGIKCMTANEMYRPPENASVKIYILVEYKPYQSDIYSP